MNKESIQQEATIGSLFTDAIKLHELDVNTVEKQMDVPNGILTKLMNDEFYTNSIPVVLFKNLIVSLHIPIQKVIDAMVPTFKLLQSKETPESIKKKPMGYQLWENEASLNKYIERLKSLYASQFTASPVQFDLSYEDVIIAINRMDWHGGDEIHALELIEQLKKLRSLPATTAPIEQPENNSKTIDSYLRKMKVDGKTKITLALLIELLDGYANKIFEDNKGEQKGWIDVNDRLPKLGEDALCIQEGNDLPLMANYNNDGFEVKKYPCPSDRVLIAYWENITHWQPLPLPPQK